MKFSKSLLLTLGTTLLGGSLALGAGCSGKKSVLDEMRSTKDKVCKCKDKACVDAIKEKTRHLNDKMKKLTPEERKEAGNIAGEMMACITKSGF